MREKETGNKSLNSTWGMEGVGENTIEKDELVRTKKGAFCFSELL